MRKIKVLQLVEDMRLGGLERFIAMLAEGLDKEKYDVEVWCIAEGGSVADELKKAGVQVRVLGIPTYHSPSAILKLTREVKKAAPDIIHTHGYFASTIGRIAAKLAGAPVVITHLHTTFSLRRFRNVAIDRFLNLFTDKIICISKEVRDTFINAGYRIEGKAVVIYTGVDSRKYALSDHDGTHNVLSIVASLFPHKGHAYLLEAVSMLAKDFPDLTLQVIGEGCLRNELEETCKALGLSSRVRFLGKRNDIPELLSRSSLFVLPSLREGLGVAIIEAMASGLPVVASDVGGIKEVVADGLSGLLCPPGDAEALARAIRRLLSDPQMMERMGRRGREICEERFRVETMLEKVGTLYTELVKEKTRS
jgi:glycosyltransferase involved in cell wall biosynthesis